MPEKASARRESKSVEKSKNIHVHIETAELAVRILLLYDTCIVSLLAAQQVF